MGEYRLISRFCTDFAALGPFCHPRVNTLTALALCLIGYAPWPHGWTLTHISNFVILEISGTVLLHAKHCASGEVFTSVVTLEGKQITYMLVTCSLASSPENSSCVVVHVFKLHSVFYTNRLSRLILLHQLTSLQHVFLSGQ